MNYYNDIDPLVCAWTQELVNAGLIPPGKVDCRSIIDIKPDDLRRYTQLHFFNGISGWARALSLAGWPTDRPICCASLPCQSFSIAGKGEGFNDPRGQLWFPFFELVKAIHPICLVGEQVPAAIGLGWLDRVFGDLEGEGYTCGAVVLGAHSVNAPHIRQRLFWLAESEHDGGRTDEPGRGQEERTSVGRDGETVRVVNPILPRLEGHTRDGDDRDQPGRNGEKQTGSVTETGATGFWSDYAWHLCKDGKVRRVPMESESIFLGVAPGLPEGMDDVRLASYGYPLAPKIQGRAGLLKGYGNSINPYVAAEFIKAYLATKQDLAVNTTKQ